MNLGSVLASLAASYDVAPQHTTTVVVKSASKPRAKVSGAQAAPKSNPSDNVSSAPVMVMPDKGSLDAKSFMLAMRDAGKRRTAEGKPFFDPREVRNDQIRAIHAFYYEVRDGSKYLVGYDNRQSFASQELRSMTAAKKDLHPSPIGQQLTPYVRNGRTDATLKGYVAGMPDDKARRLADLQGREVAAVEAREDYVRKSRNMNLSQEERKQAAAFAAIEHRRIDAIRKDMRSF
jgi:hypothetical protein